METTFTSIRTHVTLTANRPYPVGDPAHVTVTFHDETIEIDGWISECRYAPRSKNYGTTIFCVSPASKDSEDDDPYQEACP